ncbi:MAG: hypothetical protein GQ574_06140 [Crocinitomix sp.]|nr:hypothetical protein [Crocinitomix sp.]
MYTRKEALQYEYWAEFIDAIYKLENNGNQYTKMVNHHMNMQHNMHTMGSIQQIANGPIKVPSGTQRFLPWHRQYLLEFEKLLQTINPKLYIPYWDWSLNRDFPKELKDLLLDLTFKISNRRGGFEIVKTKSIQRRFPFNSSALPNIAEVQGAMNETNYVNFSVELEGRGIIDDNTGEFIPFGRWSAGLHNLVHGLVGGIMGNTQLSPADPVFWLHHAYCDKIWWDWQKQNPNEGPTLTGQDKILDPWTVNVDELNSPSTLPYTYI